MSSLHEIEKLLPTTCRILAVSKLQSEEKIRTLYEQGQRSFGENYVQEMRAKQKSLQDLEIDWHFIGRLQKNKVKDVVGFARLIHSVDSLELLETIDRKAGERGLEQSVLLQVNLALEETKGGFSEAELLQACPRISEFKNIQVQGLMTMPPLFDDPEQGRPYFRRLRELSQRLEKDLPECRQLSMGTSSDYLVAANEGATWVRLGTILFGERSAR